MMVFTETSFKDVSKPSDPHVLERFGPISELSMDWTRVLIEIGFRWLRVIISFLCIASGSAGTC